MVTEFVDLNRNCIGMEIGSDDEGMRLTWSPENDYVEVDVWGDDEPASVNVARKDLLALVEWIDVQIAP